MCDITIFGDWLEYPWLLLNEIIICSLFIGESFTDLMYFFRMGLSTIASIVPEVLKAIYDVLHEEYLKVSKLLFLNDFFFIEK